MTVGRSGGTAVLLMPMLLLLMATLFLPVVLMFLESVRDVEVREALPETLSALSEWFPSDPVPQAAYSSLRNDLAATDPSVTGRAASRLNIAIPGARTLLLGAARAFAESAGTEDPKTILIEQDKRWGEARLWQTIVSVEGPWTEEFLLAAADLRRTPDGLVETGGGLYRAIYIRTFVIAITVAALCLLLGLPVALFLASLPRQRAIPLLLVLMLPLWTSVLVRAMAWILLLQSSGLVNEFLMALRLIDAPLSLVFNRIGVLVAMTHVLLPFMILPIYNSMRTIPRRQLLAAGSLGATPFVVFRRVYLPQCRSGIAAGCLLVFAAASGYYVTPALVGGGSDQMLGTFVELAALRYSNQPLAAALGVVFLFLFFVAIGALFLLLRPMKTLGAELARV